MTEAEWLTCSDPEPMLAFIRRGIAVLVDELPSQTARDTLRQFLQESLTRKLRLFACWCCRRIWNELVDERSRKAVEVAEYFVDGIATETQRSAANSDAGHARDTIRGNFIRHTAAHVAYSASGFETADVTTESANVLVWVGTFGTLRRAQTEQAQILRCVLGNPFRPVSFEPAWRTSDVLALAKGIYDERAFDRMPILADALQDAGCNNDDILSHCRDTGTPHARGCWVVDLILGKS